MMKRTIAGLLVSFLFLGVLTPFAYGRSTDWSRVTALKDKGVAIKSKSGKMTYGTLIAADDNELTVQLVVKKKAAPQTVKIQKSDVKKVWTAELKEKKGLSRGTTTAIGAGVGAGAGLGLMLAVLLGGNGTDEPGPFIIGALAIGAGVGAGLGALGGGGGHKKLELIYEVK